VAVAQGAQRLIVLPTGYACALDKPPVGAVANALYALTLLVARQLWMDWTAASIFSSCRRSARW
jgi:hypothetical protein